MGGNGSGITPRRLIELICKLEECHRPFTAKRKDVYFCSKKCRKVFYDTRALLKSKLLVKCRICNEPINPILVNLHFKLQHNIDIVKIQHGR